MITMNDIPLLSMSNTSYNEGSCFGSFSTKSHSNVRSSKLRIK